MLSFSKWFQSTTPATRLTSCVPDSVFSFRSWLKTLAFRKSPKIRRSSSNRRKSAASPGITQQIEPRVLLSCGNFLTYSQGAYGNDKGDSAPIQYLTGHFDTVFTDGVKIGDQTAGAELSDSSLGHRAALFSSATAVRNFLSSTGTTAVLSGDSTNTTDSAGVLAGHTLAMMLNLGFDAANPSFDGDASNELYGDLIYQASSGSTTVLNGLTVSDVVDLSNRYLSGETPLPSGVTGSTLTEAMNMIIGEWDNGIHNVTNVLDLECPDTVVDNTVTLSGSCVVESGADAGSGALYTFTATLSAPSVGTTTITTDQGVITIADGESSGTLGIQSGNYEDVYVDPSSLYASMTGVTGDSSFHFIYSQDSVESCVEDTNDLTTVAVTGIAAYVGPGGDYTFTATVDNAPQGDLTLHTSQGDIVIPAGDTVGTLVVSSTLLSMSLTVTGADGGNFENLNYDDTSVAVDAPVAGLALSGMKYNDLDHDGSHDAEEDGIASWTIAITYTSWVTGVTTVNATTDADGNYSASFTDAVIGSTFSVQEVNSDPLVWTEIEGLSGYTGTVADTGTSVADVDFGNHHSLITQAGKTIGFWSNKNGAAIISATGTQSGNLKSDVFALLKTLNLRNADGSFLIKAADTSLTTKTFQTWLTSATSKNMANMLSAQLAATVLNVSNTLVDGGLLVDFSAVTTLNSSMIAELNAKNLGSVTFELESVSELISAAKAELAVHGTTIVSDSVRTYQEALKNIFDAINNNKQIFAFV